MVDHLVQDNLLQSVKQLESLQRNQSVSQVHS
jgi:hypothetical protein